jgi:ribosomal protein L29
MKIQELKTKTGQELALLLKELREKQRRLKFDLAEKKLKNVREFPETKKIIARILTLMKKK